MILRAPTEDAEALAQARKTAEAMAAIWGALSSTVNPERRRELIERHGAALVKASNQHAVLLEKLGLQGPYSAIELTSSPAKREKTGPVAERNGEMRALRPRSPRLSHCCAMGPCPLPQAGEDTEAER